MEQDVLFHKPQSLLFLMLASTPMNQKCDANTLRKELQDLAFINGLELGKNARQALKDRMLAVAFKLKEVSA